jgi:predicted phage tail protein
MDKQHDGMEGEQHPDEITEDDAMAMLEFHSMIHNSRTIGAFFIGIAIGAAVAASSMSALGYGPRLFYVAAGVFALFGVVLSVIAPRALMSSARGGPT